MTSDLQIQINEDIILRFIDEKLNLEHLGSILFILTALYEGRVDLLDIYDDSNKEKRVLILYRYLVRKGLIEEKSDDETLYELTEKGAALVKFVKTERKEKEKTETKGVEDWVQDWINLFPEGKVEGRYLRSGKLECADRLTWFIKNYGYDKDTIIEATKRYLESQQNSPSGHMYTRNANYFIFKGRSKQDRTSDLATWCQIVQENPIQEDPFNKLV